MMKSSKAVPRPATLDPASPAYIDEYNHNHQIVKKHKGKDWSLAQKELRFNLYAPKPDPDVKSSLSKLFGNKCAYCETSLAGQDLHTEHYRPKAKVTVCATNTDTSGYWWLAADWDNLLPACNHCNRSPGTYHPTGDTFESGKGNFFPLQPGSPRALAKGQETTELPSLINPRVDEPSDFLTFKILRDESIARADDPKRLPNATQRANDTINIMGLNRPGLVNLRNVHLKKLRAAIKAYVDTAQLHQKVSADKSMRSLIRFTETMLQDRWNDIYDNYFSSDDKEYLLASIRCLEAELDKANLSLNMLLGGKSLHLPAERIT